MAKVPKSLQIQAAFDDKDVVADEQECRGHDSHHGHGQYGEASRGGVGRIRSIHRWLHRVGMGRKSTMHVVGGLICTHGDEDIQAVSPAVEGVCMWKSCS